MTGGGARSRACWFAVYSGAALMALLRSGAWSAKPSLLVDPYWLEFWLLDYSGGFQRRALLGTVFRWFAGDHPNVVVVNVLAMVTCVAILATVAALLYARAEDFWGRASLAVLLASPLSSVFFEVLGDPLEVVFVLFLACGFVISRCRSNASRFFVGAAFCIVAVLVHEAAVFLFVPAIVLLLGPPHRKSLASFIAFAAVATPLLVAILASGVARPPSADVHAVNPIHGVDIPRFVDPLEPFSQSLERELLANFGTKAGFLQLLLKLPRVWYVPCVALVLMAGTVWRKDPGRALYSHWLYLTACSAPLFLIAHDWGRFSAITFWLAVIVSAMLPGSHATTRWVLIPRTMPEPGVVFAVGSCLILGAGAINPDYRYQGMPAVSLLLLLPAAIAFASWVRWSRLHDSSRAEDRADVG